MHLTAPLTCLCTFVLCLQGGGEANKRQRAAEVVEPPAQESFPDRNTSLQEVQERFTQLQQEVRRACMVVLHACARLLEAWAYVCACGCAVPWWCFVLVWWCWHDGAVCLFVWLACCVWTGKFCVMALLCLLLAELLAWCCWHAVL